MTRSPGSGSACLVRYQPAQSGVAVLRAAVKRMRSLSRIVPRRASLFRRAVTAGFHPQHEQSVHLSAKTASPSMHPLIFFRFLSTVSPHFFLVPDLGTSAALRRIGLSVAAKKTNASFPLAVSALSHGFCRCLCVFPAPRAPRVRGRRNDTTARRWAGNTKKTDAADIQRSGVSFWFRSVSVRTVRDSRSRPARSSLSGVYAREPIKRRQTKAAPILAFGLFAPENFPCVCVEGCRRLRDDPSYEPEGGGVLFFQRSPRAVSFRVARSCIASCAAADKLKRFQRQYAYSG